MNKKKTKRYNLRKKSKKGRITKKKNIKKKSYTSLYANSIEKAAYLLSKKVNKSKKPKKSKSKSKKKSKKKYKKTKNVRIRSGSSPLIIPKSAENIEGINRGSIKKDSGYNPVIIQQSSPVISDDLKNKFMRMEENTRQINTELNMLREREKARMEKEAEEKLRKQEREIEKLNDKIERAEDKREMMDKIRDRTGGSEVDMLRERLRKEESEKKEILDTYEAKKKEFKERIEEANLTNEELEEELEELNKSSKNKKSVKKIKKKVKQNKSHKKDFKDIAEKSGIALGGAAAAYFGADAIAPMIHEGYNPGEDESWWTDDGKGGFLGILHGKAFENGGPLEDIGNIFGV